jgi:ribose 5-phosphate isomerase A
MNKPGTFRNYLGKDPKFFYEHITEHFLDKKDQTIGLGSGKTVADFLTQVKGLSILESMRFVTSSLQIKLQAKQCNLNIGGENDILSIQVLLDGADQVDSEYHMIKGGGGALFREKILFKSARQVVILASREKYVNNLQRAVPVEVHPFARALFVREINNLGTRVLDCTLRFLEKGFPFFTENGNVIFDVQFESIGPIRSMETDIKSIPGVIEVGLFPRPANACYYKIYPDNSFETTEFGVHSQG